MPDQWTLLIPAPTKWLDANRRARLHHMQRSRETAQWRDATFWYAAQAKLPKSLDRVGIAATLWFPTNRHRDRENYYDAVKPCIDALTDPKKPGQAGWGLIRDDTPKHLAPVVLDLRVGKPSSATVHGLVQLLITDLGETR